MLPGARVQRRQASRARSSQVVSRVNPVAGRASKRSLNGAMQATRRLSVGYSLGTQACSRIPRIARLSPGHATPGAESGQVRSSQVKSRQVCHLQVTRGPPWDAPGPCLAHAPRRGAHPGPPENGTPQGTHARPRPAVSRWSVSVRRVRAAAGAHTCAARVRSGHVRSGQAGASQKSGQTHPNRTDRQALNRLGTIRSPARSLVC